MEKDTIQLNRAKDIIKSYCVDELQSLEYYEALAKEISSGLLEITHLPCWLSDSLIGCSTNLPLLPYLDMNYVVKTMSGSKTSKHEILDKQYKYILAVSSNIIRLLMHIETIGHGEYNIPDFGVALKLLCYQCNVNNKVECLEFYRRINKMLEMSDEKYQKSTNPLEFAYFSALAMIKDFIEQTERTKIKINLQFPSFILGSKLASTYNVGEHKGRLLRQPIYIDFSPKNYALASVYEAWFLKSRRDKVNNDVYSIQLSNVNIPNTQRALYSRIMYLLFQRCKYLSDSPYEFRDKVLKSCGSYAELRGAIDEYVYEEHKEALYNSISIDEKVVTDSLVGSSDSRLTSIKRIKLNLTDYQYPHGYAYSEVLIDFDKLLTKYPNPSDRLLSELYTMAQTVNLSRYKNLGVPENNELLLYHLVEFQYVPEKYAERLSNIIDKCNYALEPSSALPMKGIVRLGS